MVMMNTEENYLAELEYNEYQRIINTVEVLSQEQYELCLAWNTDEAFQCLNNIGNGRWLNINVYSEADHHDRIHRMESGI